MAKQKTKKIPFSNIATEVERGVWEWKIRGMTFRWRDNPGMNLFFVTETGELPMLFSKNLNDAALFTEGFRSGIIYQQRQEDEGK